MAFLVAGQASRRTWVAKVGPGCWVWGLTDAEITR